MDHGPLTGDYSKESDVPCVIVCLLLFLFMAYMVWDSFQLGPLQHKATLRCNQEGFLTAVINTQRTAFHCENPRVIYSFDGPTNERQ